MQKGGKRKRNNTYKRTDVYISELEIKKIFSNSGSLLRISELYLPF